MAEFTSHKIGFFEIDQRKCIKRGGINYSKVFGETCLEGWQHFHLYYACIKFPIGKSFTSPFLNYVFPLHESTMH